MTTTPEQAASWAAAHLRELYSTVTRWDTAVLDQVVLHLASHGQPFGMNQIRVIVPDDVCRKAGLYFHALVGHDALHPDEPRLLLRVGDEVSINPKAHGKRVNVYLLTRAGRKFIEDRQAARIDERRAA
ncbi:hypothetical protein [Streptomyces sp. NPDC001530]|uniref:hypothetical protein n=1 Tax=Streptomyces sp. NPDC001530 TaxID=3364582 RepID=UPI0036D1054B